jgi:hypothetical protein
MFFSAWISLITFLSWVSFDLTKNSPTSTPLFTHNWLIYWWLLLENFMFSHSFSIEWFFQYLDMAIILYFRLRYMFRRRQRPCSIAFSLKSINLFFPRRWLSVKIGIIVSKSAFGWINCLLIVHLFVYLF